MKYYLLAITLLLSAQANAFEVYGAIRNKGEGFEVIKDSGHEGLNICNVKTTDTYVIFDYCGKKARFVQTLIITPDETYAVRGIIVGASVGLDKAVIKFGNGKLINPHTLKAPSGNFWIYGKFKE